MVSPAEETGDGGERVAELKGEGSAGNLAAELIAESGGEVVDESARERGRRLFPAGQDHGEGVDRVVVGGGRTQNQEHPPELIRASYGAPGPLHHRGARRSWVPQRIRPAGQTQLERRHNTILHGLGTAPETPSQRENESVVLGRRARRLCEERSGETRKRLIESPFMFRAQARRDRPIRSHQPELLARDRLSSGAAQQACPFLSRGRSTESPKVTDRTIAGPVRPLPESDVRPFNEKFGDRRRWRAVASPDDRALFISVGSNSDHGENGIDAEKGRASILKIDPATGATKTFAAGLRNPVGMDFEPRTGTLWTVVNERDELGGDLVPDYLTSIQAGDHYGWPYIYYGDHLDPRVEPQRPDLVARARVPGYALGPHGAPLGLTFADGAKLGSRFTEGAFIGQHGSWNRKPQYGYRVTFVPFHQGRPAGPPVEVLTDFLDDAGNARGRPVGVAIDRRGGLLVADDVGNAVWRVSTKKAIARGGHLTYTATPKSASLWTGALE